MDSKILIFITIVSGLIVFRSFLRDITIELKIRHGISPREARKGFKLRKFFAGDYQEYFHSIPEPDIFEQNNSPIQEEDEEEQIASEYDDWEE